MEAGCHSAPLGSGFLDPVKIRKATRKVPQSPFIFDASNLDMEGRVRADFGSSPANSDSLVEGSEKSGTTTDSLPFDCGDLLSDCKMLSSSPRKYRRGGSWQERKAWKSAEDEELVPQRSRASDGDCEYRPRKNAASEASRTYRFGSSESAQHNSCSALDALRRRPSNESDGSDLSLEANPPAGLETRQRGSSAALSIISTMSSAEIDDFLNSPDPFSELTLGPLEEE